MPKDALGSDPTAFDVWHRMDNRFVPLRATVLIETLAADTARFGPAAAQLREVGAALQDVIDQEALHFERDLDELYSLFNPDRETKPTADLGALRTPEAYESLSRRLSYLLTKANYERLSGVQIEAVLRAGNSHGLKIRVNPERVEYVHLWVRGRGSIERPLRTWRHPIRGLKRTLRVFRRLVVVARLKADPHVILKQFKDIPEADVEALLPHAEVDMNLLDRLMVLGGGAGAAVPTLIKIFNLLAAALTKLLWTLVVGAGAVLVRTLIGYFRARRNRDGQRTRHLYYQNLTNNHGAIHTLIAMIAQEELKEALLAYAFTQPGATQDGCDEASLAGEIESYLTRRFDVDFSFDVHDALETLTRLGLRAVGERLESIAPGAALERLSQHWRDRLSSGYHTERCGSRRPGDKSAVTSDMRCDA